MVGGNVGQITKAAARVRSILVRAYLEFKKVILICLKAIGIGASSRRGGEGKLG